MTCWWTLTPHDPLLVRDGRPFEAGPGKARTLPFPLPMTVAGAIRTRIGWARRTPGGAFGLDPSQARAIAITGPLLLEKGARGSAARVWLPSPRDCVLLDVEGREDWRCHALSPEPLPADAACDLPPELALVGHPALPAGKASRRAPAYWSLDAWRSWLERPADLRTLRREQGIEALPREERTHVGIAPGSGTAQDGALFSTEGLRFHVGEGSALREFALLVACDEEGLEEGLLPLGGERRLSRLEKVGEPSLPPAPRAQGRRYRVLLLTPALFDEGAVPERIHGARVLAAAVGRPLTFSGWNLEKGKVGPKPSRRAAASGSVYWVELDPGADPAAWIRGVHLHTINSNPQDDRDGFGLAVVGAWT